MTFYEVVRQVLELLRSQRRVSYRALKREFDIDDDYIEDLKEEIIEAQQLAVDENGRILVWMGERGDAPPPSSQPARLAAQPGIERAQPASGESPPTSGQGAERRQLTVMFVDLVDSTRLSSELDPEIYREIVREYQRSCSEVVAAFSGHIAQLLGDGLLVYFGYPQAHEDDAQRAVRAGLGIIEAIAALNARLEPDKGVKLAVRLGIHTGLVVVGEMGGEGRQEQLALGSTPNIAARIQGLAEPDTAIISEATYRLIQGYFDCESWGEHGLRGVAEPIFAHRVLSESGAQSRLDIARVRGLTPLVGRESESALLVERWEQAKAGHGQVILLSGEAGIGKSRLIQVIKDQVANEPHMRMECRSSPYFTNSVLYPITDFLQRLLRFQSDDTLEQKLEKLTQSLSQFRLPLDESVPLHGALLSLSLPEDQYPPLDLSPQRQRQKTLEAIVANILELAERQPVLFILEDLHWTDPTTLELINLLIDQAPTASLYALLTCRSEFQPAWTHRSYLTEITVNRLSREQITMMAQEVSGGKGLPDEIIQQLVEKTDGVPLYVEEMTKSVLESGVLTEMDAHYELTGAMGPLTTPATLQDSLMARLDRLVTAKAVAQYASVIGRRFSYELLQAVSQLDETTLQHELGRLVEAELIYQRGVVPQATYIFKHALIQDIAYESLLRSTRQGYHQRIAEVLIERFPETAESQPELLAYHFTETGLNEQAVHYWYQAGQRASERSAYLEAVSHLTKGLERLDDLPETPERMERELTIRLALGASLQLTKGYAAPEVGQNYRRAQALCEQAGDTAKFIHVLLGLRLFYQVGGAFQSAREVGEQAVTLAQQTPDQTLRERAHQALGHTLFSLGEFEQVRLHCEQGLIHNDTEKPRSSTSYNVDSGVSIRSTLAWSLWYLGFPEQARVKVQEALLLAQEFSRPPSLERAWSCAAIVHQLRVEAPLAQSHAEAALIISQEQGFAQRLSQCTILQGWALTKQGRTEEGIRLLTQGITANRATGAEAWRHYWLALLAEAYGAAGQIKQGLTALDEALALVALNGECYYEAELHRLRGQLLLQQSTDNLSKAASCFQQAIAIAQRQSAKSWELRAATSLARLWRSQGKHQDAYDLLAPVYGWFTEGLDTPDLIDATTLLAELEKGSS